MSLHKALQEKKLDTRLIDYNLQVDMIKKEDLQKHLSSLPDLAHNCEKIDIDERRDYNGHDSGFHS